MGSGWRVERSLIVATYYATSSLTAIRNSEGGTVGTTGLATSSGGAPAGYYLTSSDIIIFDVNSGPARDISIINNPVLRYITSTGCAAGMTMSGGEISFAPALNETIDLSGFQSVAATVVMLPMNTNYYFKPAGTISHMSFNGSNYTLTLTGHLNVTGTMAGMMSFNANSYNVTAAQIISNGGTISLGTGTWTVTGIDGLRFNSANTIVAGSSTIVFSGSVSRWEPQGKTFYNVTVDTGTTLNIDSGQNATMNTLRLRAGCSFKPGGIGNFTFANLIADGTAARITLQSGGTSNFTKTGGGKIYTDNLSITNFQANPVDTFYARNSVIVSNAPNWTIIPGNHKLLNFL